MKEIYVICPQCGQSDSYFEYEKGDFTDPYPCIFHQPWKCPSCGYPETQWNNYIKTEFTKATVCIKITDQDENIIRDWNE